MSFFALVLFALYICVVLPVCPRLGLCCRTLGPASSALDTEKNLRVAIKKLSRPFQSAVHAKRTYRELRLLKHMYHENVIGLLDVFHPGDNNIDSFEQIYLCTHLMGADLNNIIRTQRLSDDHVKFLVYQILRGLKYVHSAGIIHRVSLPLVVAVDARKPPNESLSFLRAWLIAGLEAIQYCSE